MSRSGWPSHRTSAAGTARNRGGRTSDASFATAGPAARGGAGSAGRAHHISAGDGRRRGRRAGCRVAGVIASCRHLDIYGIGGSGGWPRNWPAGCTGSASACTPGPRRMPGSPAPRCSGRAVSRWGSPTPVGPRKPSRCSPRPARLAHSPWRSPACATSPLAGSADATSPHTPPMPTYNPTIWPPNMPNCSSLTWCTCRRPTGLLPGGDSPRPGRSGHRRTVHHAAPAATSTGQGPLPGRRERHDRRRGRHHRGRARETGRWRRRPRCAVPT